MSDKRVSSVRLIWLEAFVIIDDTLSFKEAGKKLNLHPTVIKKYLTSLEAWLDTELHVRYRDKIMITHDGREFLPKAKTIIEIMYTSRQFTISKDNKENQKYVSQFFAKFMQNKVL